MIDYRSGTSVRPTVWRAIRRGMGRNCPACGQHSAFRGYLSVVDRCGSCGEELGLFRADDLPPYLTIFIVGHIVVPFVLWAEQLGGWSMWLHMAIWPAVAVAMTLALLPFVKGGVLGLMLALGVRGDESRIR